MTVDVLQPRSSVGDGPLRGVAYLLRSLGAVIVGVVASAVVWLRLGSVARNVVWAEDSRVFLGQRLHDPAISLLWRPYAGYQQLVPRLLTDLAVVVQPVERYAVTVTLLSCVVIGGVAAAVFVLSADVVPNRVLRALLALVPAILPLGPIEIAGNLANLHWFLLFLAPWVFRAAPRSWWASAVLAVVALLVTGSEIQSALFLPLVLVGLLGPRRSRALPVAVAGALGIAWQIASLLAHPRPADPHTPSTVLQIGEGYLMQALGGSGTADVQRVETEVLTHGWAFLVLAAVLVLAVLVLGVVVAGWSARIMVLTLAVASGVLWAAAVVLNPGGVVLWASATPAGPVAVPATRYAACASMFLLAAMVVAAAPLIARGGVVLPVLGWIVVAAVVVASASSAVPANRRELGPSWANEVVHARTTCADHPSRTVFIAATPDTAVWGASVPCRVVLGGAP